MAATFDVNLHCRTSVRECLELYLKEEKIDEFKCDLCKRTGKVTKKTDIVKFPPLLIIHLSRFYNKKFFVPHIQTLN